METFTGVGGTIGEQPFLKLRSFEPNLIRLICHNHIDLPKNNRYSLNQVDGWRALMKLRNDAAFGSAGASGDTIVIDDGFAVRRFRQAAEETAEACADESHRAAAVEK